MARFCWIAFALFGSVLPVMGQESMLSLELTSQQPIAQGADRFHRLAEPAQWPAAKTAIIVCDVWDAHHSINAVRRLEEFVPRLNEVIAKAREEGVLIIHSPSDCMDAYSDHPARMRATLVNTPSMPAPDQIAAWCSKIPGEERGTYPIDQTDGGEDDDPQEHQAWAEKLAAEGRNPGTPWLRQHPAIQIDADRDYITDHGDEVWGILSRNQIDHVILTGVHTNMCVLGRPFGLRQMVRTGKDVVLMRDMTDTMYNPQRWPFVSHFTGTDLIIDHIERFVCPTITSDQILGGQPFRFSKDQRPHVVFVLGESLYETSRTLPEFALANLGRDCQVSFVYADDEHPNSFPGIEVVRSADLLVVSVRRRTPPTEQLQVIRDFIASGKPVVGLRTASHAFAMRGGEAQPPLADWPEFDRDVWGGNYRGHYPDSVTSNVSVTPEFAKHPWFEGLAVEPFVQSGSLYQPAPLAQDAVELLSGHATGQEPEPVAWLYQRPDGGTSFYTSLGHPGDFENPVFVAILQRAILGLLDRDIPELSMTFGELQHRKPWKSIELTSSESPANDELPGGVATDKLWYRCAFRVARPSEFAEPIMLRATGSKHARAWLNGEPLKSSGDPDRDSTTFQLNAEQLRSEETDLLVIQLPAQARLVQAPELMIGDSHQWLSGTWEVKRGSDPALSELPLPAKFGIPADIYLEPQIK